MATRSGTLDPTGSACWTTSTAPAGSKSLASTSTVVANCPRRTAVSGIATGGAGEVGAGTTSTRIAPLANGALPKATVYCNRYGPGRVAVRMTVPALALVTTVAPAGLATSPASSGTDSRPPDATVRAGAL